jgi:hypothetical protein
MLWFVGIFVATLCRQVEEIVSGLHQVNPAFVRRVGFGKCRRSCRVAPSFSSSFALYLPYCKVASGDGRLNHWEWECWLRVPDSYIVVVLASPDGSANGSWPPPADGCL